MQVRTDLNVQVSNETQDASLMSPGTYLGGSSEMLSPSITAQQPITPADGKNLMVHFEFPPDLSGPQGFQHQQHQQQPHPYPSTDNPNPMMMPVMEATGNKENQAPDVIMAPVHHHHQSLQPFSSLTIQDSQNNHMTVLSQRHHQSHAHHKKTDIHTLGTGSTKSIHTAEEEDEEEESSMGASSSWDIVPFSQRTSSALNTNENISFSSSTETTTSDVHHPKRAKYKQLRKQARVVATAGGMVVGGLTLGPAGIVVGAGVGVATNQYYKRKDKRAQQKYEQNCFQQFAATESTVARHEGAFC